MSEATQVTNEAIDRAERGADPEWLRMAEIAFVHCAQLKMSFTSDDVWDMLQAWAVQSPRERRAMGPIVRKMVNDQIISLDGYTKSRRVVRHQGPISVYKSLIFDS